MVIFSLGPSGTAKSSGNSIPRTSFSCSSVLLSWVQTTAGAKKCSGQFPKAPQGQHASSQSLQDQPQIGKRPLWATCKHYLLVPSPSPHGAIAVQLSLI